MDRLGLASVRSCVADTRDISPIGRTIPKHATKILAALISAAAMGLGSGQAEAATTKSYDMYLRYEGTYFNDLVAYEPWNENEPIKSEHYPASDPLGLNIPNQKFPGLSTGGIIRFLAQIVFPDDPNAVVTQYGNGGSAPVCLVGSLSCTNTEWTRLSGGDDDFDIRYSDMIAIRGSRETGSKFTYAQYYPDSWESADGLWRYHAWYSTAEFTVVQNPSEPAPVPLPASAALLPMGIGAIALMRRRRSRII